MTLIKKAFLRFQNLISVLAELVWCMVSQVDPEAVFGTGAKFELLFKILSALSSTCLSGISVLTGPQYPQVTTTSYDRGDVERIL